MLLAAVAVASVEPSIWAGSLPGERCALMCAHLLHSEQHVLGNPYSSLDSTARHARQPTKGLTAALRRARTPVPNHDGRLLLPQRFSQSCEDARLHPLPDAALSGFTLDVDHSRSLQLGGSWVGGQSRRSGISTAADSVRSTVTTATRPPSDNLSVIGCTAGSCAFIRHPASQVRRGAIDERAVQPWSSRDRRQPTGLPHRPPAASALAQPRERAFHQVFLVGAEGLEPPATCL